MTMHPEQCDKCGRFAFEKCIKPGQAGCPRNAGAVVPDLTPVQKAYLAVRIAPAPDAEAIIIKPASIAATKAGRALESRAKGYTGDVCRDCSNFTMVRNGTCLKCDTCGATSGCS